MYVAVAHVIIVPLIITLLINLKWKKGEKIEDAKVISKPQKNYTAPLFSSLQLVDLISDDVGVDAYMAAVYRSLNRITFFGLLECLLKTFNSSFSYSAS